MCLGTYSLPAKDAAAYIRHVFMGSPEYDPDELVRCGGCQVLFTREELTETENGPCCDECAEAEA